MCVTTLPLRSWKECGRLIRTHKSTSSGFHHLNSSAAFRFQLEIVSLNDFGSTAEKVSSLGKDWHKFCLKCERCNKTLNPGGHAEVRHGGELKNLPFCSVFYCFPSFLCSMMGSPTATSPATPPSLDQKVNFPLISSFPFSDSRFAFST